MNLIANNVTMYIGNVNILNTHTNLIANVLSAYTDLNVQKKLRKDIKAAVSFPKILAKIPTS